MADRQRDTARLLAVFGLVSLAAVATGAVTCAASGVPTALWLRNLAAWAVGGAVALVLARVWRSVDLPGVLWATPVGLALSLTGPSLQGVHRWLAAGPLLMNVAMVLLPPAVVVLAARAEGRRWPWFAALAALGLLVAQPDASQATALAAAVVLVAIARTPRRLAKVAVIAVAVGLAVLAWTRPDPLQPVPEVEQIVGLALALSPALAILALLLLLGVAAAPVLLTRSAPPAPRLAGQALGLLFALWAVAPFVGAFPVPLVGVGLSPILGAWLGVGALAALLRLSRPPPVAA